MCVCVKNHFNCEHIKNHYGKQCFKLSQNHYVLMNKYFQKKYWYSWNDLNFETTSSFIPFNFTPIIYKWWNYVLSHYETEKRLKAFRWVRYFWTDVCFVKVSACISITLESTENTLFWAILKGFEGLATVELMIKLAVRKACPLSVLLATPPGIIIPAVSDILHPDTLFRWL